MQKVYDFPPNGVQYLDNPAGYHIRDHNYKSIREWALSDGLTHPRGQFYNPDLPRYPQEVQYPAYPVQQYAPQYLPSPGYFVGW